MVACVSREAAICALRSADIMLTRAAFTIDPPAADTALVRRPLKAGSDKSETGRMAHQAKTTPKSLRTRKRILDAAMSLFAERGYHASSNAASATSALEEAW